MDTLNALNTVNLEHGSAVNGRSECSECCEFETCWCYEWTL